MPTLSKSRGISSKLRKRRGGANAQGQEVRARKHLQNMEERGLYSESVATKSEIEGAEKHRSYNDQDHIYDGLKGFDASPKDLRQARQEVEGKVRQLVARIEAAQLELKFWEVWLSVEDSL